MADDDQVFKALADPTRRFLLDLLFVTDGRTLTQLESELAMSRFGVMKHLRVLAEAGLVVTRRSGREKLHFLNPVPIRLIHDRWIDKYTEPFASMLTGLKNRLEDESGRSVRTVQVYRIHVGATRESIWTALTEPALTARYGYRTTARYELRPGGRYQGLTGVVGWPEVAIEGEVVEVDPPGRLVQTWHPVWDPAAAAEPVTRLTYQIEVDRPGVSRLTLTHDLTGAARTAALVGGEIPGAGGGWSELLSDLKTLLETGQPLPGGGMAST
ncbi:metalloregulator ArsR/SmtB family transcription factor [Solwaraspora sp. WMMD1047]|uniref:ArsR/SmtB family transcription factor n=1 Tax=Solwaraspora sp. WMMD1047 TaxID=3016102 RepID=UPI00241768A9|nr:metalloregulator ArsR/SmtB family transcription factor [Solwaraspora sp. WMMD1047]MDG4831382.1 metalloregulator ArsR/SmtB family transcription factor [Solwaraspora sp. WMMD1047]